MKMLLHAQLAPISEDSLDSSDWKLGYRQRRSKHLN